MIYKILFCLMMALTVTLFFQIVIYAKMIKQIRKEQPVSCDHDMYKVEKKDGETKTVFISGAITHDPDYKQKFDMAEKALTSLGYIVLSPAWLPSSGFTYDAYMRMARAMMLECDAICLLEDWKESDGAKDEYLFAYENGLAVEHFEWLVKKGIVK
jgi:hypothetical protein